MIYLLILIKVLNNLLMNLLQMMIFREAVVAGEYCLDINTCWKKCIKCRCYFAAQAGNFEQNI